MTKENHSSKQEDDNKEIEELKKKAENLQKIGAFKFRGAMNSILKLDDDKKNVLAWSSGNHAPVSYTHLTLPTNREV